MDVRTGFNVYHYQGLPVYRCNLADSDPENPEVGYLLAANLGRDGVCLVHAYGTADTLGIQVDEEPAAPQQGQVRYVVHGAWTLFVFDPGAIICYGNVKPRPAREAEFSRPIRGAGRCPGRSRYVQYSFAARPCPACVSLRKHHFPSWTWFSYAA